MITVNAGWVVVAIMLLILAAGAGYHIGWLRAWIRRGAMADEFEGVMFRLERALGFARARAGWFTAETRDRTTRDARPS